MIEKLLRKRRNLAPSLYPNIMVRTNSRTAVVTTKGASAAWTSASDSSLVKSIPTALTSSGLFRPPTAPMLHCRRATVLCALFGLTHLSLPTPCNTVGSVGFWSVDYRGASVITFAISFTDSVGETFDCFDRWESSSLLSLCATRSSKQREQDAFLCTVPASMNLFAIADACLKVFGALSRGTDCSMKLMLRRRISWVLLLFVRKSLLSLSLTICRGQIWSVATSIGNSTRQTRWAWNSFLHLGFRILY